MNVVLGRSHLVSMLRNPEFYDECPEYAHLRDIAMQSWQFYESHPSNTKCANCEADKFKAMRGVCDAFWVKTRELIHNKAALAQLLAYVSKRKRYEVTELVLYYRRSRAQEKIGKLIIKK